MAVSARYFGVFESTDDWQSAEKNETVNTIPLRQLQVERALTDAGSGCIQRLMTLEMPESRVRGHPTRRQ